MNTRDEANADLVETIARAIEPGALWEEPDDPVVGWTDWWGDDWKRTTARRKAECVIATLGLTEEHRDEFVRHGFITPSADRWVTPWQEEEK